LLSRSKSFEAFEFKAGDDAPDGSLRAVFSTFDVTDRDGDIVRASAFTDGQEVPMVWAHDWSKPVGKGVVKVEKKRAVFDGQFFLGTSWGRDAYESVKQMGSLQEYSWGFRVTETQPNKQIPGYDITAAEVFEVSPVLVGANQYTETLAVKAAEDESPEPPEPEATQPDDQTDSPDWRITAQLALAAAELEELCPL
jgi:HK97 family phage prohead protease